MSVSPSSPISAILPKPPGVNLNDSVQESNNAAIIAVFVITILTIIVRFVVRVRSGSKPRLDDWLMLSSILPLSALFAINFIVSNLGLGKHVWLATVGGMTKMEKILFSSLIIYTFELALIKVAVLCFYRRVFGVNWLNHLAMFFVVGWFIGSTIAMLLAPVPISYFWTEFLDANSGYNRYDFHNWYIGNAATNVVGDFFILVVPIPIVWGLKMRTAQKVMVSLVLFLGCFVFAASIVRIHYLTKVQGAGYIDITWTMAPVCLWSTIEPSLSIISASLPTIQPIVQWALRVEHNMYLRKHMPIKRSRTSILGLRKSGSSIGTERTSERGTPMRGVEKDDDDVIRLFTHAAHVEAGPTRGHRATNDLEEYLGTNYIRVQHDVHVSYDNSTGASATNL